MSSPSSEIRVQLQAMIPPIIKLDTSVLNQLTACQHLSLSSNALTSMNGLPSSSSLKQLRILSLGRNRIKKIDGLDAVAHTLQQLWISYNEIETLSGGGLDKCMQLTHLYISNNKIKKLDELNHIVSQHTIIYTLRLHMDTYDK